MLRRASMKKLMLASLAALALAPAPAAFARPITATDLATMRRLAAPAVSPDGNWAVYQLSETDITSNRRRTDLFLLDLRTPNAAPVKIASQPQFNEHDARFSADGRWLYYLSNASGSDQLWRVQLPSGTPEKVTDFNTDVGGYLLAPSGERLAIWTDRALTCPNVDCTDAPIVTPPPGGSGRVYD